MIIGLFFFIRASVKDRTKQLDLLPERSEDLLLGKLQDYFEARAYRLAAVDPENRRITFEGYVQPSVFLAILLTLLAMIGLSCLTLVLVQLIPSSNRFYWMLVLAAPFAGVFYWRKAGRPEKILLQVVDAASQNIVRITAHRDELIQLQENLSVTVAN